MRKLIIILIIVCLAGTGVYYYYTQNGQEKIQAQYVLAKLEKRDLVRSISATGTLSAVVTVEVGSQISGRIEEIQVDYNSLVKKDQIIARLEPWSYEAQVRQAEAELDLYRARILSQEAAVLRAQAELANSKANHQASLAAMKRVQISLQNAEQELSRSRALNKKGIVSKNQYEKDLTTYQESMAQLDQAKAQERAAYNQVAAKDAALAESRAKIKEAQAQVRLKQASLDNRRVDLENTIIRSPVDGIVIDRAVDVGQTVAASLQAPVLFTIAQDLKNMEVAASLDEADIGSIREGQEAYFTVDAFGARKFQGRVSQIRKAAKTVQNVVTYTVIISAANRDLALLPGMTADVRIVLQNRPQVLAAPNAALRFTPPKGAVSVSNQAQAVAAGGARAVSGRRVARLAQSLNLSPEQQQTLESEFKKLGQQMRQASGGSPMGMPTGGARANSRQRESRRKKMESIVMRVLTPQQREKYRQVANQNGSATSKSGNLYTLQDDGGLKAFRVRVGVSDGYYSEVRGPGLEPGMQVVVGKK
jgi:HlyD family secretion protein